MSAILPYSPCLLCVCVCGGGVPGGGGGSGGERGGGWGGGQGTFHPPCQILHYHMVLRPKGTSHNQVHSSQSDTEKLQNTQHVAVDRLALRLQTVAHTLQNLVSRTSKQVRTKHPSSVQISDRLVFGRNTLHLAGRRGRRFVHSYCHRRRAIATPYFHLKTRRSDVSAVPEWIY